jgi:hypothetical protein
MDFSIINYDPKFKPLILDLFKKTFHKVMTLQFWDWKFENNPFGKPIIKLAFNKKQLIGTYIANPVTLVYGKKSIPVLYSTTTMTDPDFVGHGISSSLAKQVCDLGRDLGYKAIIGYANNLSHEMFVKKLGFIDISKIKELIINIPITLPSNLKVEEISNFNELPETFYFNLLKFSKKFSIKRDTDYLNWRFKTNPENQYFCFKIVNDNNFFGYFILKIYKKNKCHIVDFLLTENPECYNSMLNFSQLFCKKFNLNSFSLWSNYNNFSNYIDPNLVNTCIRDTFFISKILGEPIPELDNFSNWTSSMSDSDVF